MSHLKYDDIINGRTNKYESTFFHIYLEGESPITNSGFRAVNDRDYASFIHEYIHYIQQITTPYGIKYNKYFTNNLLLFREFVDSNKTIPIPVILEEVIQAAKDFESELRGKNGSKDFSKCNIGGIEIAPSDIANAKINDTAVNIGVYDFENERVFAEGFQFGYTCVMESMAHLIQFLVNPDLYHRDIPYRSAQLICDRIRPDIKGDTRLLVAICYTSLFFNNPGHAFFEILGSASKNESGIDLFRRYMMDYSRTFRGEQMPNYRMMHMLMNDFIDHLEALLGNDLIYIKEVINNCKHESSKGTSVLLDLIYTEDLGKIETLDKLLDFYGFPAIDSKNNDIVFRFNPDTNKPYIETAALLSLELIFARLTERDSKKECIRFKICDRISRGKSEDLIDECCAELQWKKQLPCIFTKGLSYWRMSNKVYI